MISIAEQFYSIQGEGKYQGSPAVFIRLAGCNLTCGYKLAISGSWRCDTYEVWRKGRSYTINEYLSVLGEADLIDPLTNNVHLVITGGEPLLQQSALVNLLKALKKINPKLFVEVETNGAIDIHYPAFNNLVNIYNISPKLSNSGERYERRKVNLSYKKLNYILKFVVNLDRDLWEVEEFVDRHNIPKDKVYLMPAAESRAELIVKLPWLADVCKNKGFNLSNRLHLQIWDIATGV